MDDPLRGDFPKALLNTPPPPRAALVRYRQWGEGLEHDAVKQWIVAGSSQLNKTLPLMPKVLALLSGLTPGQVAIIS